MLLNQPDVKSFLREELVERMKKNPSYSMRAFARNLGIAPSMLGAVLTGQRKLSEEKVIQISQTLELDEKETTYLRLLCRFEATKSQNLKADLLKELNRIHSKTHATHLDIEHFRMISEWYHLPLLESFRVYGPQFNEIQAAKAFGISVHEVRDAIERFLKLELIESAPQGGYEKTDNRLMSTSQVPNEALRNFHKQMLAKALVAIDQQTPEEKYLGTETFVLDGEGLKKAKELSNRYLDDLVKLATESVAINTTDDRSDQEIYHAYLEVFKVSTIYPKSKNKNLKEKRK
jgi:uncharacterized protein (TIGR02147 family)